MINFEEIKFQKKHLNKVLHTTLNPEQPGVVRIHLIPPKKAFIKPKPSIAIINGKDYIPVNLSWAIVLACFIEEVNEYGGREITDEELENVVSKTIKRVKKIYVDVSPSTIKKDLKMILNFFIAVARGEETEVDVGQISLKDYAKYMKAPHRMDLMISSMKKNKRWNCNQKCLHCYAASQAYAETDELSTEDWKFIIDKCRDNYISQLTFTGGEPTLRKDLVDLVKYSEWFVTRLNTNGVLLTEELCKDLYEASLDSVQVTLYSFDKDIHNKLVGADNFDKTVQGIKNALAAGLNVSTNTPLCTLNEDYIKTLEFIKELGVTYATCSGLIITGNARTEESIQTQLSEEEITIILKEACKFAKENKMEISFTSPGWVKEETLRELGLEVPSCGACLSNMAISPNGNVVPCQSWLRDGSSLGNMLLDSWDKIWNSEKCKKIRENSAKVDYECPLRKGKVNEK